MGKAAIVIGATGVVGRALVDQLVVASHIDEVVTLTRRPAPHSSPKVHNRVVDFERLGDYADAFKGDLFFSCLGTTRKLAGSIEAQRRVDLDYQYHAAQLAAEQGVEHCLLVSSSAANASSGNAYLQMKGELEQRLTALPFKRLSIFRPSLLLGQRSDLRIGEKIGACVMPVLCLLPGLRRYRPIRGSEVAAKMVRVSAASGEGCESFDLDAVFPAN